MRAATEFEHQQIDAESSAPRERQFDLQHYGRMLRKNRWPIILFTTVMTALAGYYAFTATPVYQSTATLLIEPQKANILEVEAFYGEDVEDGGYYQTQYEMLRSRGLAERVVRSIGVERFKPAADAESSGIVAVVDTVMESADGAVGAVLDAAGDAVGIHDAPSTASLPGATPPDRSLDDAVAYFSGNLAINPVRNTSLVRISYLSPDAEFAATVANTVASEYIESVREDRTLLRDDATEWMDERIALLEENVQAAEQRLIDFKLENGLVDVDGSVGRLDEQQLLLATTELAQARVVLSDAEDLRSEVQSLQRENPALLRSLPAVQADPLVRGVQVEFGQAQRTLDELRNRYGSRHPRILDAQSQLDSLSVTLDGHVARVVDSLTKDAQLQRQRVAALEATLARGKEDIQLIGEKSFELDALEREVAAKRSIYDQFFARITETRSADGLDESNARVSDPAVAARGPIKPKKQLIIALAAIASLMLSMVMALLYEHLDDTITATQDVEETLGVRLLGILPLVGRRGGRKRQLPLNPETIADERGIFHESVNTVRTALTVTGGEPPKIVLVTSSIPGEGKSTTAINLAYSFSQLERVLLIDCDLRRPSIARALGENGSNVGLTDLIIGSAPASRCVVRGAIGSLDVITSGSMPRQPLELLSSQRFARILRELSTHYDRIIIDSAPTQAVSDALVLSRLADAVVYVIKSHDTERPIVKRGLARLQQVRAPIAGIVMTQVDVDKLASYGGGDGYAGYYDQYGYSTKGASLVSLTPSELHDIRNDNRDVALDMPFDRLQPSNVNRPLGDFDPFGSDDRSVRQASNGGASRATNDAKRPTADDLDIL